MARAVMGKRKRRVAMARYCVVAPPQILTELHETGHIGRNHLLLAHDIVKKDHSKVYEMIFHPDSPLRLPHELIVLDNSVVELKTPVDLKMIAEAAKIVVPNCIALPDRYLDTNGTIADSSKALDPWSKEFENGPLMYIPQGRTPEDFFKAATAEPLMSDSRIQWWGIPRNIVQHHGTRRNAIDLVRALNPQRKIHLFGFSENLYDDIICARHPAVESIDSAVPLRQRTPFPSPELVGPRGHWWEEGRLTALALYNIQRARDIFGT
jgi:hypothetical protein